MSDVPDVPSDQHDTLPSAPPSGSIPPPPDITQEAIDLSDLVSSDNKRRWAAIGGLLTALASGGGVLLQSGMVNVSFGKPSDQEHMGPCPPPSHCPSALEVQSMRDRLKSEEESRRRMSSRLEDTERRLNVLIAKEQATGELLGTMTRAMAELKDAAQNLNTDARNRNIMSTDALTAGQGIIEKELEEVAEDVAYFRLEPDRGRTALAQLLPETFEGIVHSDRWRPYERFDLLARQLCHAHLRRDFQALIDRGGGARRFGKGFLKQSDRMFKLWHAFQRGEIDRDSLADAMEPIWRRWEDLATEAAAINADEPLPHTTQATPSCADLQGPQW